MDQSSQNIWIKIQTVLFHPLVHLFLYPLSFILFGIILGSRINQFNWLMTFLFFSYSFIFYLIDQWTKRQKSLFIFIKSLQGIITTLALLVLSGLIIKQSSYVFIFILFLNLIFLYGKEIFQQLQPVNHVYVTMIRSLYFGMILNTLALYLLGHVILYSAVGLMIALVFSHWIYLKINLALNDNVGLLRVFKMVPYLIVILGSLIKSVSMYALPITLICLVISIFGQQKLMPANHLIYQRIFVSYEVIILSVILGCFFVI